MTKRPLFSNPFIPAIVYTAAMTAAIATSNYLFHIPYGAPGFTTVMMLPLMAVTAFTLWVAKTQNIKWIGNWRSWRAWAWVAPWLLVEVILATALASHLFSQPRLLSTAVITLITCIFVGIGEEVMYRGVTIQLTQKYLNIYLAMALSAALFSLLHAGNILGGLSGPGTIAQLKDTLIFGLALAPIAILSRTLIPLIVMHAGWDFLILTTHNIAELKGYVAIASLVDKWWMIIAMIIAWTLVFLKHRTKGANQTD